MLYPKGPWAQCPCCTEGALGHNRMSLLFIPRAEGGPAKEAEVMYTAAAVGPPQHKATRKWCSVCGFAAPYKCVRCGSRFCTRKCYAVHIETRCLKFVG